MKLFPRQLLLTPPHLHFHKSPVAPVNSPTEDVAFFLWDFMSLGSKKKTKISLQEKIKSLPADSGINYRFRQSLGINLFNSVEVGENKPSNVEESVEQFFLSEDISKVSPDIRKMSTNPSNPNEKVPIRFALSYFTSLHHKYLEPNNINCSYSSFVRCVPHYIRLPQSEIFRSK